jgi:hypothetical protein
MPADVVVAWCDAPSELLNEDEEIAKLDDGRLAAVYGQWQGEEPVGEDHPVAYLRDWKASTRARLRDAFRGLSDTSCCTSLDVHGYSIVAAVATSYGEEAKGFDDVVLVAASGIGQRSAEGTVPGELVQIWWDRLLDAAPSELLARALKLVIRAEETVVAGLDEAKINEVRNELESVIDWMRS